MNTLTILSIVWAPIALCSIYSALKLLSPKTYREVYLAANSDSKYALTKLCLGAVGWFLMIYGGLDLSLYVMPNSWIIEGVSIRMALSFTGAAYGAWLIMRHLQENALSCNPKKSLNPLAEMDERLIRSLREKGFEVDEQAAEDRDLQATVVSQWKK